MELSQELKKKLKFFGNKLVELFENSEHDDMAPRVHVFAAGRDHDDLARALEAADIIGFTWGNETWGGELDDGVDIVVKATYRDLKIILEQEEITTMALTPECNTEKPLRTRNDFVRIVDDAVERLTNAIEEGKVSDDIVAPYHKIDREILDGKFYTPRKIAQAILSSDFGMSPVTIGRWAIGRTRPSKFVQKIVIRDIQERVAVTLGETQGLQR